MRPSTQAAHGEVHWDLPQSADGGRVDGDAGSAARHPQIDEHRLALERLPEIQEMLLNRERGFSGTDIPLTPEQELAAVRRRTTR